KVGEASPINMRDWLGLNDTKLDNAKQKLSDITREIDTLSKLVNRGGPNKEIYAERLTRAWTQYYQVQANIRKLETQSAGRFPQPGTRSHVRPSVGSASAGSSSNPSWGTLPSTSTGTTSSLPKTWSGVSPGAAMANAQQLAAADRIAFLKRAQQAKEYWDSRRDTADDGYDYLKGITEQAGRNMQNAFADFLFKPMENGFKGMVQGFIDALRKMAANLLASKIFQMLGDWGKSNAGGGFIGTIATIFGGLFGGARATGGPVSG